MPLYEAKMIHHYDTRWATYEPDGSTRLMTEAEKANKVQPMPRYWVHECEIDKKVGDKWDKDWFLGWRDICRATDERTMISTLLPRVAFGDPVLLAMPKYGHRTSLEATFNSFVFDFVTRQKSGGTHLKYFTTMQLAAPGPQSFAVTGLVLDRSADSWVGVRADRLNAWTDDVDTRANLRAELDALMFHVYGVNRDDADYIMETFPIVKRKDVDQHGEYRTKLLILESYDAMAVAIATGEPYRSPFQEVTP